MKSFSKFLQETTNKENIISETPVGAENNILKEGLDIKSIASSLDKAEKAHQNHLDSVQKAMDKLPIGHSITYKKHIFTHTNIGGDKFWISNKGKGLTGSQLYQEIGHKALISHIGHKALNLKEAWGNIFSRNKESGHLVTGGQGGGGSSPYMRYGSGGGRVRLSQGSTSSGKQKLTTSLIQKLGGGNFMRTRQSFVFGGSSLKKNKLFKTPKFK